MYLPTHFSASFVPFVSLSLLSACLLNSFFWLVFWGEAILISVQGLFTGDILILGEGNFWKGFGNLVVMGLESRLGLLHAKHVCQPIELFITPARHSAGFKHLHSLSLRSS